MRAVLMHSPTVRATEAALPFAWWGVFHKLSGEGVRASDTTRSRHEQTRRTKGDDDSATEMDRLAACGGRGRRYSRGFARGQSAFESRQRHQLHDRHDRRW